MSELPKRLKFDSQEKLSWMTVARDLLCRKQVDQTDALERYKQLEQEVIRGGLGHIQLRKRPFLERQGSTMTNTSKKRVTFMKTNTGGLLSSESLNMTGATKKPHVPSRERRNQLFRISNMLATAQKRRHSGSDFEEIRAKHFFMRITPEPEDPAVVVRSLPVDPDGTSFLVDNFEPLGRVHNLVLGIVSREILGKQAATDNPVVQRRKSCESWEFSGGPARKLTRIGGVATDFDIAERHFLHTLWIRQNDKIQESPQLGSYAQSARPWFLERNKRLLNQNLEEMKDILVTMATDKEERIYFVEKKEDLDKLLPRKSITKDHLGGEKSILSQLEPSLNQDSHRDLKPNLLQSTTIEGATLMVPRVQHLRRRSQTLAEGASVARFVTQLSISDMGEIEPDVSQRDLLTNERAEQKRSTFASGVTGQVRSTIRQEMSKRKVNSKKQLHQLMLFTHKQQRGRFLDFKQASHIIKMSAYYCGNPQNNSISLPASPEQQPRVMGQAADSRLNGGSSPPPEAGPKLQSSRTLQVAFGPESQPVTFQRLDRDRDRRKSRAGPAEHTPKHYRKGGLAQWIKYRLEDERTWKKWVHRKSLRADSFIAHAELQQKAAEAAAAQNFELSVSETGEDIKQVLQIPKKKTAEDVRDMMASTKLLEIKKMEETALRRRQVVQKLFNIQDITSQFFIKDAFKSPSNPKIGSDKKSIKITHRHHATYTTKDWTGFSLGKLNSAKGAQESGSTLSSPSPRKMRFQRLDPLQSSNSRLPGLQSSITGLDIRSARTHSRVSSDCTASAYKTSAVQSTLPFFISKLNC